jgi:uncharacterized protein YkwD
MKWDQYLGFATKEMAVTQGATTQTGHTAPNGDTMSDRLDKRG